MTQKTPVTISDEDLRNLPEEEIIRYVEKHPWPSDWKDKAAFSTALLAIASEQKRKKPIDRISICKICGQQFQHHDKEGRCIRKSTAFEKVGTIMKSKFTLAHKSEVPVYDVEITFSGTRKHMQRLFSMIANKIYSINDNELRHTTIKQKKSILKITEFKRI